MTKLDEIAAIIDPDAFTESTDAHDRSIWDRKADARRKARAVVEVLREPTEEMKAVGGPSSYSQETSARAHRMMIDALLKQS